MDETSNLLKYLFEVGQLKYVKRSGWWLAKVKDPESVAEHSFRTAILAYVIAKRENSPNPEKTCLKALLHDMHETRLLDKHKVASNYSKTSKEIERKVEAEQCKLLGDAGKEVYDLLGQEDVIAKDADYLEAAITAKEYFDAGHKDAFDWIQRVSKVLKTKTAKELCALLTTSDSNVWWQGLKEDVEQLKY